MPNRRDAPTLALAVGLFPFAAPSRPSSGQEVDRSRMGNEASSNLLLWYDKPAARWVEALPLGNGRLGAMVYGGFAEDRISLNDDTLYSGEPGQRDLPLDVTKDFNEVTRWLRGENMPRRNSSRPNTGADALRRAISRSVTCILSSRPRRCPVIDGNWTSAEQRPAPLIVRAVWPLPASTSPPFRIRYSLSVSRRLSRERSGLW